MPLYLATTDSRLVRLQVSLLVSYLVLPSLSRSSVIGRETRSGLGGIKDIEVPSGGDRTGASTHYLTTVICCLLSRRIVHCSRHCTLCICLRDRDRRVYIRCSPVVEYAQSKEQWMVMFLPFWVYLSYPSSGRCHGEQQARMIAVPTSHFSSPSPTTINHFCPSEENNHVYPTNQVGCVGIPPPARR